MRLFALIFTLLFLSCENAINDTADLSSSNTTNSKGLKNTNSQYPNILLVIADDMGLDATPGYNVGTIKPNMPNLQSLAANGLTFDNAWAYPKCSPTRAALLTGKYGYNNGVLNVGDHLSLTEKSLQTYLNENSSGNYAHSIIGKWHLTNGTNDAEVMGADYYAGFSGGGVGNYYDWDLYEDGQSTNSTEYCTTKFTDLAIDWIGAQTKPWFCWLAYSAPHTPYHLPPTNMHSQGNLPTDQASISANPLPYYMAMIESIDHEIGRLKSSIPQDELDNTIIIFVGDNGTPRAVLQSPYTNAQGKGSLFKGGVNVPLIISGATVNRINARDDAPVNTTDLFSTIAEIAGVSQTSYENSASFKSLLTSAGSFSRDYNYSELTDITKPAKSGYTITDNHYKLIMLDNGAEKFYDMTTDAYEQNVIKKRNQTSAQKSAKNSLIAKANIIRN